MTARHPEGDFSLPGPSPGEALRHKWESGLGRLAGAHRRLGGEAPRVALTFDDGPHPIYTPKLLDNLKKAGVLATFFWVGQRALSHPALAKRVRSEGHCLGSHSFSHAPPRNHSLGEIRADYLRGVRAIEEVTGERTALFRPPYGSITARSLAALRQLKLDPWLWSVDPGDWKDGITTNLLLDRLENLGAGDVVLLHDGADDEGPEVGKDRSSTVELIAPLAELMRARGLSFATLDGRVRSGTD
jgi:peptidoglycan-N-acetylglucosamine deacetylase